MTTDNSGSDIERGEIPQVRRPANEGIRLPKWHVALAALVYVSFALALWVLHGEFLVSDSYRAIEEFKQEIADASEAVQNQLTDSEVVGLFRMLRGETAFDQDAIVASRVKFLAVKPRLDRLTAMVRHGEQDLSSRAPAFIATEHFREYSTKLQAYLDIQYKHVAEMTLLINFLIQHRGAYTMKGQAFEFANFDDALEYNGIIERINRTEEQLKELSVRLWIHRL